MKRPRNVSATARLDIIVPLGLQRRLGMQSNQAAVASRCQKTGNTSGFTERSYHVVCQRYVTSDIANCVSLLYDIFFIVVVDQES